MTTATVDYFACKTGELHSWEYRGKKAQAYRCRRCRLEVSKSALKGATD